MINAIGQRSNVVNTGTAFADDAHTVWGYNDRREVTSAHRRLGTDPEFPGSEVVAERREYAFDSIGNRETHADGGGTPVSYTANDLNQHTAAGLVNYHLLILDETDTILRKFTWGMDIAEQANGLRSGARPDAKAGGVGGLLGVEEVSGSHAEEYVYFYDANGNVGQVLDWDAGTVAAHYQYDPFGREITATGTYAATNRFRFSTKHLDRETNLYYYGYRYYSPEMGRWLNRDPIGEAGSMLVRGEKKINLMEESNLYRFVMNDLLSNFDALGLASSGFTCPADKPSALICCLATLIPGGRPAIKAGYCGDLGCKRACNVYCEDTFSDPEECNKSCATRAVACFLRSCRKLSF